MYEWDETKRQTNLEKHGLDFRDAQLIFDGRPVVHVPTSKNNEARFASIANVGQVATDRELPDTRLHSMGFYKKDYPRYTRPGVVRELPLVAP
jgi:hypothetical protein